MDSDDGSSSSRRRKSKAPRPHKCIPCNKSFVHKGNLDRHMDMVHKNEPGDTPDQPNDDDQMQINEQNELYELSCEGRTFQVKGDHRMTVKSTVTGKKLSNANAPKARDLEAWLSEHPDYELVPPPPARDTSKRRAAALKAARTRKLQREREALARRGEKPILDGYEKGPCGVYITELQGLYREAKILYTEGRYEIAEPILQECLQLAEETMVAAQQADELFNSFKPIEGES